MSSSSELRVGQDARRRTVVLLVDDSADERDMYAAHLEASGFQVLEASTAAEGFETAVTHFPEIVVTDIAMPGTEDGFVLTAHLKQDARTMRTPVIVLTGHAFEMHREEARRANCDRFLAKPCLPADLERTIRELLAQQSKTRQVTVRDPVRDEAAANPRRQKS